jgi:hypothetical protein
LSGFATLGYITNATKNQKSDKVKNIRT